jgi:hypothetical protein
MACLTAAVNGESNVDGSGIGGIELIPAVFSR